MKQFISSLSFLLIFVCSTQAQVAKNIVKSYPHEGASVVTLAATGVVEVEEWDEDIIRLVTNINAVNFNEATLKALAKAGRYTTTAKKVDGTLIITMLKAQIPVKISGVLIQEQYTFKIYVPRGTMVEQKEHQEVADHF